MTADAATAATIVAIVGHHPQRGTANTAVPCASTATTILAVVIRYGGGTTTGASVITYAATGGGRKTEGLLRTAGALFSYIGTISVWRGAFTLSKT